MISSHSDGDTEREGDLVTFQGSASDTNNSADELLAGWYSGSDVLCEEAAPDASGLTRCEAVLDTLDADISLQVRDPSNATAVARVSLVITATDAPVADIQSPDGLSPAYTDQPIAVAAVVSDGEDAALVGTPPEVIITLPLPGAEESESAIVPFEAMVDDDTTPPEALDIVWESDIDGVIDETAADSSGFVSWDTESLSVGDHLITVTVTDSDGFSTVETVELRIDGAPSAPAVDIEPSDPADEDDLVAAIITDSVDP